MGPTPPTALMLAAASGDVSVTQELLALGADANPPDVEAFTPLFLAVANGDLELVKVLIDAGANVRSVNLDELTALELAEGSGNEEIARMLRANGARTPTNHRRFLIFREGFEGTLLVAEREVTISDRFRVKIHFDGGTSNCTIGHRTCPYGFGADGIAVWAFAGLVLVAY